MKWLLDTCVLSELSRKRPDPNVMTWMESVQDDLLFISVLTVGELRKGIAANQDAARRESLQRWLESDVLEAFSGAILPIDREIAERWGILCGEAERSGRTRPAIDALLAATALVHGLTVATRNVGDFSGTGAALFNPFG